MRRCFVRDASITGCTGPWTSMSARTDERPMNDVCALLSYFFFQAEDGIRDLTVTGVQTCALPISQLVTRLTDKLQHRGPDGEGYWADRPSGSGRVPPTGLPSGARVAFGHRRLSIEIGRASCRERV